jgi:hypothetical protein
MTSSVERSRTAPIFQTAKKGDASLPKTAAAYFESGGALVLANVFGSKIAAIPPISQ